MVQQSVQSYQATTANELKAFYFITVVFWLSDFCEYLLLFFYKPVYSCKDTTIVFERKSRTVKKVKIPKVNLVYGETYSTYTGFSVLIVSIGHKAFANIRKNVFFLLLMFANFLVLYAIILLQLHKMIDIVLINTNNFK